MIITSEFGETIAIVTAVVVISIVIGYICEGVYHYLKDVVHSEMYLEPR